MTLLLYINHYASYILFTIFTFKMLDGRGQSILTSLRKRTLFEDIDLSIKCIDFFFTKYKFKDVLPFCTFCKLKEDIKHLLYNYDCEIVKPIWEKTSSFLKFTVTWKIIVLGFYNEVNEKTLVLNNLIAFVAYTIYKYKVKT